MKIYGAERLFFCCHFGNKFFCKKEKLGVGKAEKRRKRSVNIFYYISIKRKTFEICKAERVENEQRKILTILEECKDLAEAKAKIKALLQ